MIHLFIQQKNLPSVDALCFRKISLKVASHKARIINLVTLNGFFK